MKRIVLLLLALLATVHIQAQTEDDTPAQVMQLGRGTADALDWHPDGDVLAVGGATGIWLYDDTLADVAHFDAVGAVSRLAWSPAGDLLASLNRRGGLQVWSVTLEPYAMSLQQAWTFDVSGVYPALDLVWAPDNRRLAVIAGAETQVLDTTTGDVLLRIPDLEYAVTWHPDGTQIAGVVDLGSETGEHVRVWDAADGAVLHTYVGVAPGLFWSDIQWSPDGSVLVGATVLPATLHAWSTETGDLLNDVDTYAGEFGAYHEMWWSADGAQLFTVSSSVTPPSQSHLGIWDAATWTPVDGGLFLGNVKRIAKHPDAAMWTVLTWGDTIAIWALDEAEPLHVRSVHSQPAQILAWSPDGRYLAVARHRVASVYVWDTTLPTQTGPQVFANHYSNLELASLHWHAAGDRLRGIVNNTDFTAPGTQVTGFVVEWDTQTGEYLGWIHETGGHIAHDGSGSYLPRSRWSEDFTRVATIHDDERVTISTVVTRANGGLALDEVIATIEPVEYVSGLTWSPDHTMLAFITRDTQGETAAWVYDAETGELINRLRPTFFANLYDLGWSPDSTMVALVGSRGIAGSGETEYRLDIQAIDRSFPEARTVMTVLDTDTWFYHAWHPGSRAIAVTTTAGVGIYQVDPGTTGADASPAVTIPDVRLSALAWSPDGTWLAGGHEDGTLRVWDMTAGDA